MTVRLICWTAIARPLASALAVPVLFTLPFWTPIVVPGQSVQSAVASAAEDTNFSQFTGWADYFARRPRSSSPAEGEDRRLLERFRPRFMLPAVHEGMIDFYRDYIAHGRLRDGTGRTLETPVTREILNAHREDPRAEFVHEPPAAGSPRSVVYGRIDREVVDLGAAGRQAFAFLSYHAVFRHSGLPAGLHGGPAALLRLIADLDDWHQLDHYTVATIVLDQRRTPVALMLQQHNYVRMYLRGAGWKLPSDQRAVVDVAIRSNELYPHAPERRRRPAVRFLTPEAMRYLLGFASAPQLAAEDITDGVRETFYELEYLPPSDAFYSFQGFLGARRLLPGRTGPPGADFNTLPIQKSPATQFLAGFWREGDAGDHERFERTFAKTGDMRDFARVQAPVIAQLLQVLAAGVARPTIAGGEAGAGAGIQEAKHLNSSTSTGSNN